MKEFIFKDSETKPVIGRRPDRIAGRTNGNVFHKNYLEYLSMAYGSHHGIIVKPDFIWFTILCELSQIINKTPEVYRFLFTEKVEGKDDIIVLSGDPVIMPIDTLVSALFKKIPDTLSREDILLEFSTTGKDETFAFSTAFLEAASPYYNYSMYLCGYNKIMVLGTMDDYRMMWNAIDVLASKFGITDAQAYLNLTKTKVQAIIDNFNIADFWENIFTVKYCGSGHQEEAQGWFKDFYTNYPTPGYVSNFNSHVAIVEYKNLNTNEEFTMSSGLLSSYEEDGYLKPEFGFYVNSKG